MENMTRTRGFTLTEILIAIIVLAVTMIPVASIIGNSFNVIDRDKRQIIALQLCQAKLNESFRVPYDLLNTTTATITDAGIDLLTLGTQSAEGATFTVSLEVAPHPVNFSYRTVDINAPNYDPNDPATWVFNNPAEFLANNNTAAKRVQIVVSWSERGNQQNIRLATYRANLEL